MYDEEVANRLRNQLEQMKTVKVYMFEHDQQPGTMIADKIEKEIKNSSIVLVLLTTNSKDANFVNQEIGCAKGANIPLIALIQSGIDKNKLGFLSGVEYIPFEPSNLDRSISYAQTYIHNHNIKQLQSQIQHEQLNAKQLQDQIQREQLIEGILIVVIIGLCLYIMTQEG